MTISERIFTYLDKQSKKQGALADFIGVRPATLSDWKAKRTNPDAGHLEKIAEFLGVSIDYLVTGKESANVISNVGDSNFNVANSSNNNFFEKRQQIGEIEAELLNICSKLNTMKKAELLFLARDLMNNGKL